MGQKINPNAYRLSIKLGWLSTNNNPFSNYWIKSLINGVFLAHNYYTSNSMLVHSATTLKVILLVYDNSYNKHYYRLNYIVELLKAILEKKLNKKIVFIVRETKIKTLNAKILADWLACNIEKQPNKFKLLEKLIK